MVLICVALLGIFAVTAVVWCWMFPGESGAWRLQLLVRPPVRFARRHPLWVGGGLGLLMLPPLLVWMFSDSVVSAESAVPQATDPLIAALLRGEQLAPPPPLPPMVFSTHEVEVERPLLADASRAWDLLDVEFRQRLLIAYRIMRERYGYDMVLIEGYRSPERQDRLAALGLAVSNARAFQSYHQYGLAGDSAFMREGKLVISEKDPWAARGYRLFGDIAESLGLTWGGRWTMADLGHAELHRAGVLGH